MFGFHMINSLPIRGQVFCDIVSIVIVVSEILNSHENFSSYFFDQFDQFSSVATVNAVIKNG